jgi:hypothetical protein
MFSHCRKFIRILWILALTTLGAISSQNALAATLKCSANQSYCNIRNKSLTVGDPIAIVNAENELVAFGKVVDLEGAIRKIEFSHRFGTIQSKDRVRRLESNDLETALTLYRKHVTPSKFSGGLAIGLLTISVGDGASGLFSEIHGTYDHLQNGLELIGSIGYLSVSGTAQGEFAAPVAEGAYALSGFSILTGAGYHARKGKAWSFRTQLEAGINFASQTVESQSDLVSKYVTEIEDGSGIALKTTVMLLGQIKAINLGLGFGYYRVQSANGFFLGASASWSF